MVLVQGGNGCDVRREHGCDVRKHTYGGPVGRGTKLMT